MRTECCDFFSDIVSGGMAGALIPCRALLRTDDFDRGQQVGSICQSARVVRPMLSMCCTSFGPQNVSELRRCDDLTFESFIPRCKRYAQAECSILTRSWTMVLVDLLHRLILSVASFLNGKVTTRINEDPVFERMKERSNNRARSGVA